MTGSTPNSPVYLDAVSAARLHPAARAVLEAAFERGFADVRRLHGPARDASLVLENARSVVAECLAVRPDEVHFVGSGTEAVHRGLLGLVLAQDPRATRIVHTAVEHSAVLHAAAWHHRVLGGPEPVSVGVDSHGRVDVDAVAETVERGPCVVAAQSANPEVGTLQPIGEVRGAAGDQPTFCDLSAHVGHAPLPSDWDVAAASARKWGGPPGVGVLVVRRGARWTNPFPGEPVIEPGSDFAHTPGALAAAAALQAMVAHQDALHARRFRLIERIRSAAMTVPDTDVVGHPTERLPHVVTFSCLYVNGEQLTRALDRRGFAVASGSACTASTLEPSHVLAAMGALTHGNVRVSLGPEVTEGDVDRFCLALPEAVAECRAELDL